MNKFQTLLEQSYEPHNLCDFIVEEDIIYFLQNNNTLCNLLLVGGSGTGKTSLLNCIKNNYFIENKDKETDNYLKLNSFIDTSIQYYKTTVYSFCKTKSNIKGKKKLIIIDDIDFLNESIQQLLKYYFELNNVIFLCSCSNLQKVNETITSRFFKIKLNTICKTKIKSNIIQRIVKTENINITDEAIDYICLMSNNNIKTIFSYFEKIKLFIMNDRDFQITVQFIKENLSNINHLHFEKYIYFVKEEKNIEKSINILYEIYNYGYSNIDIFDSIFQFVKITNMLTDKERYSIIEVLYKYYLYFDNEIELSLFTAEIMSIF